MRGHYLFNSHIEIHFFYMAIILFGILFGLLIIAYLQYMTRAAEIAL